MLEVSHVVRRYGSFTAVDDVSFSITKGEVVGLLGHNGAGKTTIMKMLTGYLEPHDGSILINDSSFATDALRLKERIGYLPEQSPLYPDMTVADFLDYVAALRDVEPARRSVRLKDVIQKTGLTDKVSNNIATLSRGYKQRLGVAQAIVHEPELLILDEPTNGLDPDQIQQMRLLIQELSEHATILLSTHILQEVQAVCDRVIIIAQGKIAVDEPLASLQVTNQLQLICDADPDDGQRELRNLEGVEDVSVQQRDRDSQYVLNLSQSSQDLAPKVARLAVEQGWDIYELNPQRRTLETIFSEVSGGGVRYE